MDGHPRDYDRNDPVNLFLEREADIAFGEASVVHNQETIVNKITDISGDFTGTLSIDGTKVQVRRAVVVTLSPLSRNLMIMRHDDDGTDGDAGTLLEFADDSAVVAYMERFAAALANPDQVT